MSQHHSHDSNHNTSHDHGHGHEYSHSQDSISEKNIHSRAFKWGISLNFLYVIIELVYGFKIDSLALIADAVHNFGDVCGLLVAWLGFVLLRRKATERMSFGLKKFSILAAFVNSVIMLLTTLWICKEALERYTSGSQLPGLTIMVIAAIGVVINFSTALLFHQEADQDLNMKAAFLHLMSDAVVSAGVIVVGLFIYYKGYTWIDPLSSAVIAIFIFASTWGVFKESFQLLMGGVPKKINPTAVKNFLEKQVGVTDVHLLHIWAVSTTENMMVAHLVIPGGHPTDSFVAELRQQLSHNFPIHKTVFQIETDGKNCNL